MKKSLQVAVLMLAFCLDIQLSAEAVYFPQNCWGKATPCAVENNSNGKMSLSLPGMSIHMDAKAIVKATGEAVADLAKGVLLAKHEGEFRWHTPFGDVLCTACEVLLHRTETSLEIHTLRGSVNIVRKGDDEKYDLPVGFSVLLSGVSENGRAGLDFPQASPLRPMAKLWAKVYPGDVEDFKRDFQEYVESWREAVEAASTLHREEADRQIASADAAELRAERLRQAREAEAQKLRALFREKNDIQ